MQKKLILCKGAAASGKSTYARTLITQEPGVYKIIEKDTLRLMLDGGTFTYENEEFILGVRNQLILMVLEAGYIPIISDCNLHPRHEREIRALVGEEVQVEIVDFRQVPFEVCVARNAQREPSRRVSEEAIRRMYEQYIWPQQAATP